MPSREREREWVVQNIRVHIQRSWVSVRCETHATARVADFSPSFWSPPIDTGDLFWIIFSGQTGAAPLSPSLVTFARPVALSVSLFRSLSILCPTLFFYL